MINKTLASLNEKVWYRFVKVLYILTFLIITTFLISMVVSNTKPHKTFDNNSSYILCNSGLKLGLDENELYLYDAIIFPSSDVKIRELCSLNPNKGTNSYTPINYQLVSIYKYEGSWVDLFKYSAYWLLAMWGSFELFKRLFFYIVLGTARPKK